MANLRVLLLTAGQRHKLFVRAWKRLTAVMGKDYSYFDACDEQPRLIRRLQRMEYRAFDYTGSNYLYKDGGIWIVRSAVIESNQTFRWMKVMATPSGLGPWFPPEPRRFLLDRQRVVALKPNKENREGINQNRNAYAS